MTVKELREKLENAFNENAEVRINTEYGELKVIDTLGQFEDCFWIETVSD